MGDESEAPALQVIILVSRLHLYPLTLLGHSRILIAAPLEREMSEREKERYTQIWTTQPAQVAPREALHAAVVGLSDYAAVARLTVRSMFITCMLPPETSASAVPLLIAYSVQRKQRR